MDKPLLVGLGNDQANFSQLDDPWDLPPYILLTKNNWKSPQTYSGYWKEKEEERTAIRSAGVSSSSSSSAPSYVGVRKTLVFYLNDRTNGGEGTKTPWICHDYYDLRKDDAGEALVLQEDVVLRKVFKRDNNETDHTSSLHRHVESCVKAYKEISSCRDILSELQNRTGAILDTKDDEIMYDAWDQSNKLDMLLNRTQSILESLETISGSIQSVEALSDEISELLYSTRIIIAGNKRTRRIAAEYFQTLSSLGITSQNSFEPVQSFVEAESVEPLIIEASELVNKLLGVLKKDLGAVPCDLEKKSENVWQDFTKICSDNDPDEMYAACHLCDKVLKVKDLMKDDTSHLISHIHTCSSCTKSNPSTDKDREMLHHLRTVLDKPYEQQMLDCQENLTQLDPGDLKTPWYVTRSLNRQTHGGQWKEIDKEFTAIRMEDQQFQVQGGWNDIHKEISGVQFQVQVPQYIGVRRKLQFEPQDGTEMNWIMFEYQLLIILDMESPALFLQGDMVIRTVFHCDKEAVTDALIKLNRWLQSDDDSEEYYYKGECVNMDATLSRKRKRSASSKRKSEVWTYFTEILTADHGVVYAVCHHCDRGYGSACSTNGTSHLWRHTKSCSGKLPGTGYANDATTEWEAIISPLFLLLKNNGETEH